MDGTIVPVTINYEFTSTNSGYEETTTVNGEAYDNVISTRLKLNLEAIATMDVGFGLMDINILNPQDVLSIDAFYAKNIGLVRAHTITEYELSSEFVTFLQTLGIELGLPNTNTITNVQELTDFSVAED